MRTTGTPLPVNKMQFLAVVSQHRMLEELCEDHRDTLAYEQNAIFSCGLSTQDAGGTVWGPWGHPCPAVWGIPACSPHQRLPQNRPLDLAQQGHHADPLTLLQQHFLRYALRLESTGGLTAEEEGGEEGVFWRKGGEEGLTQPRYEREPLSSAAQMLCSVCHAAAAMLSQARSEVWEEGRFDKAHRTLNVEASVSVHHISSSGRFCWSTHGVEFVPLSSSFQASLPGVRNTQCVEQSWSYVWCLLPVIDQSEQEQGGATGASDCSIKNGQSQWAQYLKGNSTLTHSSFFLWAFSSLSNIATLTPAAKQHQIIVFIGRLAGWSHLMIYSCISRLCHP